MKIASLFTFEFTHLVFFQPILDLPRPGTKFQALESSFRVQKGCWFQEVLNNRVGGQ
tara:strand:- start:6931 stop:7101 length:171 start_codon:yes stop_codon:yes gene_type:complete